MIACLGLLYKYFTSVPSLFQEISWYSDTKYQVACPRFLAKVLE